MATKRSVVRTMPAPLPSPPAATTTASAVTGRTRRRRLAHAAALTARTMSLALSSRNCLRPMVGLVQLMGFFTLASHGTSVSGNASARLKAAAPVPSNVQRNSGSSMPAGFVRFQE